MQSVRGCGQGPRRVPLAPTSVASDAPAGAGTSATEDGGSVRSSIHSAFAFAEPASASPSGRGYGERDAARRVLASGLGGRSAPGSSLCAQSVSRASGRRRRDEVEGAGAGTYESVSELEWVRARKGARKRTRREARWLYWRHAMSMLRPLRQQVHEKVQYMEQARRTISTL